MQSLNYEVIIIGAGPAGARAAGQLAEGGIRSLIIEKAALPRRKLCAGGITPKGMNLVPKELTHIIEKNCFKVDLYIHDISRHYISQSYNPIISMVNRDRFDHALVLSAIKHGAQLLESTKVNYLNFTENKIEVFSERGIFKADYIILADGVHSPLSKTLNWPDNRRLVLALEMEAEANNFLNLCEKARFDFGFISGGYAWVFPKKIKISIGILGNNNKKLFRGFKHYINFLGIESKSYNCRIKGHPIPMTPRNKPFYRNRVLLTGDSAGFVDPLTGEGISYALKSGILAADSIIRGFPETEKVKNLYEERISSEILNELRFGKLLSTCIYGPTWLRSFLFRAYGPSLCSAMKHIITGEKTYFQLLTDFKNYLHLFSRFNGNLNPMK